jgi:hypothetical protein
MPEESRELVDRRKETRYIPTKRCAYLGWWEGKSYLTATGWLESLSYSGAALLVENFPASVTRVWLCFMDAIASDWYPAQVVGNTPTGGTGRLVRVALAEPLPYDVFKTFGWGLPNGAFASGGESTSDGQSGA